MEHQLTIYNTLDRRKELFVPLHAPHVGMYVCGPTVYGDAHLGHARPAITFDLLFRYLTHLGYKVRYVRNITDVGHLEHDADEGEDKIAKKARLEQMEPMEVVQYYVNRYHKAMEALNVLPPSIEPHASGHIIEQIQLVKDILENGYAYESEGSVYFDVEKYNKDHHYGKLSGRNLDDVLNAEDLNELKETFHLFCFDILGLKEENNSNEEREAACGKVVDMLLEQRMKAKANKDWATSDKIRNELTALGFEIKDGKNGCEWKLNK